MLCTEQPVLNGLILKFKTEITLVLKEWKREITICNGKNPVL